MKIELHKVTWYSKLAALLLFIALPFIGFYLGVKFQELRAAADVHAPVQASVR